MRAAIGEPGSARRLFASNGAWNVAAFLAAAAAAFLLRPYVLASLGDALFGVWSLVASATGYMGLADLGVRPAVVHFVSKHDGRGEVDEVNRYVNTAFVAFAASGLLVLAVAGAMVPLLGLVFDVPAGSLGDARWALLVSALDVAASMPLNALSAVVVGKQRYGTLARVSLLGLALRSAAVVLVLRAGHGIVALALVNLGGSLVEMALKARAAFRLEPRLVFSPRLARRDLAKDLLRYGALATLVSLSLILVWQTDAMVLSALVGASAVTWFSNGAVLPMYARQLAVAAGRSLEPASGALGGRGDVAAVRRLLERGPRTLLLLAGPMLAYFVAAGDAFLARWLGASYRPISSEVLTVVAMGVAAPIASYPFVAVMYGTNRMRGLAILSIAEGGTNLGLSLALAKPMGVVGVALGTAIPAALVHLVLLPAVVGREYGLPWMRSMAATWVPALVAGGVAVLALSLASPAGSRPGWAGLAGLAVLSVAAYGAAWAAARAVANRLAGAPA